MCCGGTVATSVAGALSARPNAAPASRLRCARPPQCLAWAVGCPVLPEVKTSATKRSAAMAGIAAVSRPGGGTVTLGSGSASPPSVSATAPGKRLCNSRSRSAERSLVSRLTAPRRVAAANPTANA